MKKRDDNLEVIRLLIASLVLIFIYTAHPASGQMPPTLKKDECDHTSNKPSRFKLTAVRPPVQVLDFDGRELSVSYPGDNPRQLIYESYDVDKATVVNLPHDCKNKWVWVLICINPEKHERPYLYTVTPVMPAQMKKEKP